MKKIALLLCLYAMPLMTLAQPFTLDPAIKPVELKLNKISLTKQPNAKGKISVTDVEQVKDTLFFFAQGVSIYSPVYVGITAKDKSNPVDIRLHKMNWKSADRSGTTDAKGHWEDKFKTENDFGIMVIAKAKPAAYALVVWAGDEPKMELPTVFRKEGAINTTRSSGFFKDNLLYIIIGVIAILAVVLFIKLKNKKNEKRPPL